jgi:DNA-binding CsgD family transcriptional regulator
LVVNLVDQAPRLVLVDDCHWVDQDSLRFLAYLAQRIEGLPIAVLLAGRPPADEPGSVWAQVASRASAVALYPQPLSQSAAVALARERLGADAAEEFCRACHTATGGNPLFLRELLTALDAAGVSPSAAAATEVQAVGPAAVRRFVLHRLATLGPAANELARTVAVLGDETDLQLAGHVSHLGEEAAGAAADDLVRADIFVRAARLGFVHPIVRAALYEDLAPAERQARHAAAAEALARAGAAPERLTAHLLLTGPTGDRRRVETLRSAATAAARRGAPGAAAERLRRALAESPAEPERGEILAEVGRYEVAAMQFEPAEEHLRAALSSGANLTTRADAASMLGRCAIVSGGGSAAEAAVDALASLGEELQPLDPERSLELGSELLMVTTAVVPLRAGLSGHLQRFTEQARGHPGFEAVARIHVAQERLAEGGSAAAAADEVQAALASGLPPSAATSAAFLALQTLRLGERYQPAMQMLDVALEGARREGHAARQGLIHGQRAAIALAQGSLKDAQVEAETGLRVVEERHFTLLQLLAVAIVVDIERGALEAAAELSRRGDALGIAEDRPYVADYLIARGRLRIAQGHAEEGVADLMWCGQRLEALSLRWPGDWRAFAAPALASLGDEESAARLAREQLAVAQRDGAPGALGLSLRSAAAAIGGEERLALLQEAVSVLEDSAARLELAHALADLGAELSHANRRREGRDAQRRAMKLADDCGAIALAERARAEFQAGPGRRARIELTGPPALTAAEWRVCRQAADGHTNREIAQALFVTEKTVERHLSAAYHKLGIRSRFQLSAALGE